MTIILAASANKEEVFLSTNIITTRTNLSMLIITCVVTIILETIKIGKIKIESKVSFIMCAVVMIFTTRKLFIFLVSFETSIIPIILIITKAGQYPEKGSARVYIIVITIAASIPAVVLIIKILKERRRSTLNNIKLKNRIEEEMCCILILLFLTKLPIIITHIWLPRAHVQAPTSGSIVLAGVMLKIGGYGILLTKKISKKQTLSILVVIGIIGAVLSSIIRIRQTDIKTIVAYSSVRHMGMLLVNLRTNQNNIEETSVLNIIRHALCSPIIFIYAGMLSTNLNRKNTNITKKVKKSSRVITAL